MRVVSRTRSTGETPSTREHTAWAVVALIAAVIAVYAQVYRYGFVEFDDPGYVSENPLVQAGLTLDGVRWAFTTGHMWNWHPLTWLSHMLDVQLFGVAPGAHHLVNLALHLVNTLLLFAVLRRMTRALWPSLVVAALFAVHPLHVESVAWISERKDVLSACFFFLTLWAYAAFVETRSRRWYAAALGCFALGLMAKPMLVTVPFVLLLLDVWPLGRLAMPERAAKAPRSRAARRGRARRMRGEPGPDAQPAAAPGSTPLSTLLWEKVPFFALTVLASAITYLVQSSTGSIDESGALPFGLRLGNALVAYVRYLIMTVWPVNLAVFYPYDLHLPTGQVIGAALCLAVISVAVLRVARRHPYAAVGWLLYLGMLVPVIGLVQVGSQALADRYTYLPLIGIFVLLAWGGRTLAARAAIPPPAIAVALAAVIGVYAAVAWAQVGVWRSGETLLAHTARVTRGNYLAHNNLGAALEKQGRIDAAIEQYQEALRIKPDYDHARGNLARALRGRYEATLASHPEDAAAHYGLATALRDVGQPDEAVPHYEQAIRFKPDYVEAQIDLAGVLVERGQLDAAVAHFDAALRLAPDDARAHFNLGSTLARMGRLPEAVAQFERVLVLTPDDAEAWGNLAMAHAALHQPAEATRAQQRAVELARAKGQWSLVKTLEEWLASYRAGLEAPTPAS